MSSKPANPLVLIQLSVLLLSCLTVFGSELDSVSWAVPPNHHYHHAPIYSPVEAPIYPPVEAPKAYPPRHHHHHKGHPPAKSPSPSQPPVYPPVKPPSHSQPPVHPPVKPPSPSQPPVHPPVKPPSYPSPARKLVAVQGVVYCKSCKYTGLNTLLGATPLVGAVVKLQCKNTKYRIIIKAKTDKNGYFFIQAPKTITTYGSHKCSVSIVSSPSNTCNKPTDLHGGIKGAILIPQRKPRVPPLPFELYTVGPFAYESYGKVKCTP